MEREEKICLFLLFLHFETPNCYYVRDIPRLNSVNVIECLGWALGLIKKHFYEIISQTFIEYID